MKHKAPQTLAVSQAIPKSYNIAHLFLFFLASCLLMAVAATPAQAEQNQKATACADWQLSKLPMLHSNQTLDLCELTLNKPVLVVNTASHCGFTRQFGGLEKLHQKYKDQGLVIVGFPSDDFNQEAASSEAIADVCYKNFGVSFTMTEPVNVRGDEALALFKYLAQATSPPAWNFNKYLINRKGEVVEYFSSTVEPESDTIQQAILSLLKKS